jgi:hypothetical protein
MTSNRQSFTISFTAPVKDRTEVGPHEPLLTSGFLSTPSPRCPLPSSLKRSAYFSVVASIFLWWGAPFFTPQKNQKNRASLRFAGDFGGGPSRAGRDRFGFCHSGGFARRVWGRGVGKIGLFP